MYGVRQELHTGITSSDLSERLEKGARVVYLQRKSPNALWDAVLEIEVEEADPRAIVLDFLMNVDPGKLEKAVLEHPSMDEGIGVTVIKTLSDMVVPRGT